MAKQFTVYPKTITSAVNDSRISDDASYAAGALGQFIDNIEPRYIEYVSEEEYDILYKAYEILSNYRIR